MPSFSTTVVFLLFLVTTTTTTTIIGGNVRKIKHSKKTDANAKANTCLSRLLGKSQYTSCDGTETELDIACANKDTAAAAAAAAADGTSTKEICSYSEQPVKYDDAAPPATAAGCGDRGSFDPETHITLDHATGVCRLKFLALTDSCDADAAAPVFKNGNFGVMVEAPLSTDPGSHSHEQNEDNPHKSNSGMLLRFSIDAGVTYYNTEDPRNTVPLNRSSSRRKLDEALDYHDSTFTFVDHNQECQKGCKPSTGFWGGYSKHTSTSGEYPRGEPFETCYINRNYLNPDDGDEYCWSESRRIFCPSTMGIKHHPCSPKHLSQQMGSYGFAGWDLDYRYTEDPGSYHAKCGEPCQEMCFNAVPYPWNKKSGKENSMDNTPCLPATGDIFSGVSKTETGGGDRYPFETCYQNGNEAQYCWSKSHRLNTIMSECRPYGGDWHPVDPKYVNPVTHPYSCGAPCTDFDCYHLSNPCTRSYNCASISCVNE